MFNLYENQCYLEDLDFVTNLDLPWEKLQEKSILITGATGLIGSFLVDVLMRKNEEGLSCTVFAVSRDFRKAVRRFCRWENNSLLQLVSHDIQKPLTVDSSRTVDYAMHMAANTHPLKYATDPIGTIITNIVGTQNLLDFSLKHQATRFVFTSSNEVYGENRGDVELFNEDYCGYIDCNTLRACYPESKRCGEALCQAYIAQAGLDVVIPRVTRTYGPTMTMSDTKAISQFIAKAVAGDDIVLKSAGTQYFSFMYVADTVSGLLYILLKGECGNAYNIADEKSDITLKELASTVASVAGQKVVYEEPDILEAAGYSRATKALLNGDKLKRLGWRAKYDIQTGVHKTIDILKTVK